MMGEQARRASWVGLAVALLGVASLVVNITTIEQLSGEQEQFFAVRRTFSLLLNSGTAWAGVSVLAGAVMRRPGPAAITGMLAGTGALVVHYGLGELTGLMPAGSFSSNLFWFVAAILTGAPLGLVGALGRSRTRWGVAARLVVPLGAVVEPWSAGWWQSSALDSWPVKMSNPAAAVILTLLGLVGLTYAVRSRAAATTASEVAPVR
ncbi:hypothetical protein ACOCJ7_10155 [Knoellia sp. CPCC 206453]|uniref:hypothetical protein n=1 Tax=Knoellia pratensis TaxID=3404796 RepID=UPI003610E95C